MDWRRSIGWRRLPPNAAYLNSEIESVMTPKVRDGYDHVWHQYTIRINGGRDRDVAMKQVNETDIGTGVFYLVPVHKQDYMREIVGEVRLPVAERLAKEVIPLPVHPQLSQADLDMIVTEVNKLPHSATLRGLA